MEKSSNNILLSNLIKIRWVAILGQLLAIFLVYWYLGINIPIKPCLSIVFISALINTFSHFSSKTIQLTILLYLTGGIYNPFSLLLIAPLIISASYLPIFFSICLLILSVISVFFISNIYIPIEWQQAFVVPSYFKYALSLSLIISLVFIFIYVYLFANSSRKISKALTQTKTALINQKKISEIGSLSAAAVHELSTPLNTIFLILNDLMEDKNIIKNIYAYKEIKLLKSQAERCKNILLTLSKNPENLKDTFFDTITFSNIIKINFDKFNNSKIKLKINLLSNLNEPKIQFKDEISYSIGNLIQNSIQYAKQVVSVDVFWNESEFIITINDDGYGFKNEILDRIGEPYISKGGIGMGLGIFISKNLIENIGGNIIFKNLKDSGASVEIKIKRANL